MLKWSIMLNSGGKFDPSLMSMGQDFGSIPNLNFNQFQSFPGGPQGNAFPSQAGGGMMLGNDN